MTKRINKILWNGTEVPKASTQADGLDGLNLGELFIKNDPQEPGLYTRTTDGKIVPLGINIEQLRKIFLNKDKSDSTNYLQKFLGGIEVGEAFDSMSDAGKGTIIDRTGRIQGDRIELRSSLTIGKNGYAEGFTGFGGKIDEDANAELESLVLRRFLEVPELRFNRVDIKVGDKWRAPGGGVIERVEPILDSNGNPTGEGYFWLKLEDGEIGAIAVDDICMGIFHDFENPSNNETADSDDGLGNRTFAGFCTAYWRIEEVSDYSDETGTYRNKQVRYSIRPTSEKWSRAFEPMPMMNFVCYGNFTNEERQTSVYETRTYTRMLVHQNDWNFKLNNIALQYGDMSNFTALGRNVSNDYSLFVGNIYMTGSLTSVDVKGDPILSVVDKGEWKEGTIAAYYERYSYNGSLWLCVNESGTNQAPSENDPSWLLQVKAGQSITSQPNWDSSKVPYPASTILKFAEKIWISNKETSEPPLPLYTDPNGNYYKTPEGGYYIASETQSDDWDLLLDASGLADGEDGASIEVRYSADGTNWHFPYRDGDIYMQQRIGSDSAWSDIITFVGEDGDAGADGKYTDYQFAVNDSLTIAPTTGWKETPPAVGEGQYLWMRMRVVNPNDGTSTSWSVARIGGEEGTSVFKSTVFIRRNNTPSTPEGGSYASPLPTTTGWSDGIPEGEQILWASTRVFTHNGKKPQEDVWSTPRQMTDTADLDVEFSSVENPNPPQGHPNTNTQWSNESGTDTIWMATSQKKNGVWGEWKVSKIKGEKGIQGDGFTMMGNWRSGLLVPIRGIVMMGGSTFAAKRETTNPPLYCYLTPDNNYYLTPEGGYYLTGESNTDDYELWAEKGVDGKDGKDGEQGIQGEKGEKGDKGDTGATGYSGCVTRTWDAYIPTQIYRNDSEAAPNELEVSGIRYLDILLVESETSQSGYEAFECVRTCVGSDPRNQEYKDNISADGNWRIGTNLASAFIAKFIALDANIKFASSGQLTILDENNVVCAGMAGSQEGDKTRIWAGGDNPDNAPFRVNQEGESWIENAHITGEVNATSGSFNNVQISGNLRTQWKVLSYVPIYQTENADVWGFNGSAITDDKIILDGMPNAELVIAWGDNANGREIAIFNRVGMRGSDVTIKVPLGYSIVSEGVTYYGGTDYVLQYGHIYYMTGMQNMWIVKQKIKVQDV